MVPIIKEYEPPRRRLRIRNKIRFIVSLIIIIYAICSFFIPDKTTAQVNFIPYKVSYGDTYWNIAKELQAKGYKSNKDIRIVVDELVAKSGIKAHELKEGDIILVPDLEVSNNGRSKMD